MARDIPAKVLDTMGGIPLFAGVSRQGLRMLVQAADEVPVRAGRTLVREGESGRELYVVLEGSARVLRGGRKVAELGPGGFVGELAFLDRAPRSASVEALSDMRVLILDHRQLEVIVEQEPAIALPMLKTLAERIRQTERSFSH